MELTKKDFIYEGKAKRLYTTEDPNYVIVEYKDSFTAFNGQKKATMSGKGVLNNKISSKLFQLLADNGVESHFVKQIDETNQLVKRVDIVPLEVIVRNITTGSLCKRLGVQEGMELPRPLFEMCYKDDALGDPFIIEDHALLFGWATKEELDKIKDISLRVNAILKDYFAKLGVVLVDFKLEFGKDMQGNLILADEISPDTCRFWDKSTGDHLDKDRFRKDLGNVLGAYEEIWRRISA
ncbi:phosphoribosylaminoimidazolesuccinocarboxamide synthase [uncultured Cloacibacillus sp.]|uniref:phosphoribosylaminoimidazolesuccinocarboxamide synthase n=1 Tax=uncultured Cloacibacillus sp. TaxID=889794 RepID=UPI00260AA639|nr:phosphoribosylaminoimidazolesuccinocarboxamide synthase [uncultured Cloacibacillus sp.]